MIKGVNKQIVEINNPNSAVFEKAVLYVKPSMRDFSAKALTREAQGYLYDVIQPPSKRNGIGKGILLALAAGGGFGAVFLIGQQIFFH